MGLAFRSARRSLWPLLGSSGLSIAAAWAALPVPATQAQPALCPAQLNHTLAAIAEDALGEQARWGAVVQPLGDPDADSLAAHRSQQYFTPASNVKLLTSAAALVALGPNFQITTSLYAVPTASRTGLAADSVDLWVVGRGDPSFDGADLQQLAQQARQAELPPINQLVGDERYLGDRFINPTWDWEDVQSGYGAPVNSLILDQNAIGVRLYPQAVGEPLRLEWEQPEIGRQWQVVNQSVTVAETEPEFVRVGRAWESPLLRVQGQLRQGAALDRSAVAVTEPGQQFLQRLAVALREAGVTVSNPALLIPPATGPAPPHLENSAIATVISPPLSELLVAVNAQSRNLYAEALIRHLGRTAITNPAPANAVLFAAGLAQVKATLTPLGVTAPYQIADGSGLSRRSLVTPLALAQTLQVMAQHPHSAVYRRSLAVAGETGTLRSRFRGTPVAGRFWGKSGGLTGVSSLSGYLDPPSYPPLVVSVMIDHSDLSGSMRRQTIDAMVAAIARLTSC